MEEINIFLCLPLLIICPEKASGILSMASRACSIFLDGLEQGYPGCLKAFGACFSNIGLRYGHFLIKLPFGGKLELLTSEFHGILSWELTFPRESFSALVGKCEHGQSKY